MKTAIAAMDADADSRVAEQAVRAPCFQLFDDQGRLLEVVANPFAGIERGAAPKAAALLAGKGVERLVAGEFGPRFLDELATRHIAPLQCPGRVADALRRVMGGD